MTGSLDGITVVEFGQFVSVPFCAQLMADAGAPRDQGRAAGRGLLPPRARTRARGEPASSRSRTGARSRSPWTSPTPARPTWSTGWPRPRTSSW
ncbi:hypothetical protein DMP15_30035 [Pseudonocardia sp. UM4_GMWB1]|uniref:CoA transferase n=1 Tax=Pseudonocardia sp. UM4_GMWB1 TaxID=2212989 RepID=UPI00309F10A1